MYGQTCDLFHLMSKGNAIGIVSNREAILDSFALIRPTVMLSVPTLFNKVYDGVMAKIAQGSPLTQRIFKVAKAAARARNVCLERGQPVPFILRLQHAIFDKIVFKKIRDRFGGNLRFMGAGGAATSRVVLEFFEDIGIPICNGYGLTETSPVVAASSTRWSTRRIPTCGVLLKDVHVLFIDPNTLEEITHKGSDANGKQEGVDGELCVSGPLVMQGYHNKPEATAEVFIMKNNMKYFRTGEECVVLAHDTALSLHFSSGDLGRLVEGRYLQITGRIKEQFKLENGKYVVPIPAEEAVCRSLFIAQVMQWRLL